MDVPPVPPSYPVLARAAVVLAPPPVTDGEAPPAPTVMEYVVPAAQVLLPVNT